MITYSTKIYGCIIITLLSFQVFAGDTIKVTVTTNENSANGIGYSVDGRDFGGAGKSYVGDGPKNKRYFFGYRKKSLRVADVSCGALTLTKNSNVMLVMKGSQCQCHVVLTNIN
jgi:hypothetical protein